MTITHRNWKIFRHEKKEVILRAFLKKYTATNGTNNNLPYIENQSTSTLNTFSAPTSTTQEKTAYKILKEKVLSEIHLGHLNASNALGGVGKRVFYDSNSSKLYENITDGAFKMLAIFEKVDDGTKEAKKAIAEIKEIANDKKGTRWASCATIFFGSKRTGAAKQAYQEIAEM